MSQSLFSVFRGALRPSTLLLRRFRREDEAATAVEFGIIVLPFLAVLLAIEGVRQGEAA